MSLPPLPSAGLGLVVRGNRQMPAYMESQVIEYGQQCRCAAFDEAIKVCASLAEQYETASACVTALRAKAEEQTP